MEGKDIEKEKTYDLPKQMQTEEALCPKSAISASVEQVFVITCFMEKAISRVINA
jgi:hypothetical protein